MNAIDVSLLAANAVLGVVTLAVIQVQLAKLNRVARAHALEIQSVQNRLGWLERQHEIRGYVLRGMESRLKGVPQ